MIKIVIPTLKKMLNLSFYLFYFFNVDGNLLRLELFRRKTFLIIVFQNVTKDDNC